MMNDLSDSRFISHPGSLPPGISVTLVPRLLKH